MKSPDDAAVQELREFGYEGYDETKRVFIITEDGMMQLLQVLNSVKRRNKYLEEEMKSRIPMELLADQAAKNLRRNPQGAREEFARTEDMLSTWSAANNGAGKEVLRQMDENYEDIMEKERAREERLLLIQRTGQQITLERGDFHDRSYTTENHFE
ncbi:MAG: hypothetical protein K6C10_06805 [Prevotella sp.]|nr:hypothetical protein [Prevotella sp.]